MKNIAYCGLNCEACSFRVAALERDAAHLENIPARYGHLKPGRIEEMELCPGCKTDGAACHCGMKPCAVSKGFSTCAECPDMPCDMLLAFCNDGAPHHSFVVENLKRMREIGEDAWAAEQEAAWKCPACGKRLSWYRAECGDCGK